MMKRYLLTGLLAAAAWAQDGIRGPMSGLVFDEHTKALRPVLGVPGASYLGAAIASGLDSAFVSPNAKLALAVRDGHLGLLDLSGAELLWTELAAAGRIRVAWNSDSTSAAVWNEDGRVDLWSGFGASVKAVSLGSVEEVTSLVLTARGVAAAATAKGIYRLDQDGLPEMLAAVREVSALALNHDGSALYAASRADNSILELANWLTSGSATLFAGEAAGILAPAGLALSGDGRIVFVANEASIVKIDRATRAVTESVALDFKASRLDRLADSGWLLNSREQGQPFEMLSSGTDAKVFFVPVEE